MFIFHRPTHAVVAGLAASGLMVFVDVLSRTTATPVPDEPGPVRTAPSAQVAGSPVSQYGEPHGGAVDPQARWYPL
jgi:hypothetical protein